MGVCNILCTSAFRKEKIRTVHIDTSLQIERCKAPKKANVVEGALRDFGFKSTSSFAKLEFKGAWLQDLAFLYKASQSVERLEELLSYVDDHLGANIKTHNRLKRCIQSIIKSLSTVKGLPYEAVLVRVRNHILNMIDGAYAWWESSVDHEFNGTACVRASEKPTLRGSKIDVSIPQCKPEEIKCRIIEFFENYKTYFINIKLAISGLEKPSNQLVEAKDIIENAEKNPKYLCGKGRCRKLGDVLIAMDGLKMDYFAANNDKEWILLSEVLDKHLINPVREAKTDS